LYMIWYNIVEQAFYAGHAEIEKYKHIHEIVGMIIRSCFCTIFICVGYYVRKYLLVKGRPIHLSAAAVILLLLICLIMNRIIPGVDLRSMFWGNAKERIWIVNYYVTEYLKAGLYVAGASCGAIGIILLCKIWGELRQGMLFRGLLFLGNNSLTIMVTHLDFHILHFGVIFANFINVYTKSSFAYHLCLLMFMFAAEIVLVRFINRFLPSVVGKKQK